MFQVFIHLSFREGGGEAVRGKRGDSFLSFIILRRPVHLRPAMFTQRGLHFVRGEGGGLKNISILRFEAFLSVSISISI